MNRRKDIFDQKKVLMGFLTAGENGLNRMALDLAEMEKEGFDIIELGMPFSDPAAEGKEIQENNIASLKEGCTADVIFDELEETRDQRRSLLVLNLYMNTAYRYGFDPFLERCQRAGVDGLIVQDLPFEERDELESVADGYGIPVISIVAEAPDARIRKIARKAKGFLCISPSVGRNNQAERKERLLHMQEVIRKENPLPVIIGSDAAGAEEISALETIGDGVRVRHQVYKNVVR